MGSKIKTNHWGKYVLPRGVGRLLISDFAFRIASAQFPIFKQHHRHG
jgi:hypothetical protein